MAGPPSPAGGDPAGRCRPRSLIVNGDDLGLTTGVNVGIERACRDGILRSASVMGVGAALADAGERVRRLPSLGVGLHLTLVGEWPACRPGEVLSLVGRDGRLLPDYRAFLRRYLRGGIRLADLRREFRAQAAAAAALGVPLDHLDSHQHLHLLPGLLSPTQEIARELGIEWIRAPSPLPRDRCPARGRESEGARGRRGDGETGSQGDKTCRSSPPRPLAPSPPRPLAERMMFRAASAWARRSLARAGFPLADGSLGFDCSGRLTADYLLRHISALPPGLTELICHPGAGDPETRCRYESWGYYWKQELDALTDPGVRAELERAGVRLASFAGVGR